MKKLMLASALTLASTGVLANSNTGCGLGSMVIQDQSSVVMQVLAATTNGISGNQTFGITSGTLGCDKPAKFVSNEHVNTFVASNMDSLATDIANGQGEVIETLAVMMEVEDKAAFAAKLQANFDQIFTAENVSSANVIDNILTVIS